ncbi:STIPL1 [Symbiodinium microadriaticum]|nr:STIPL1 [Symbiodinium sp. KB8]CAE7232074.1 STIPL1 [Symbiodinium microadriaticum]
MRQQASPCHAKCRKAVKTMGMIYASAVIVFLCVDGVQAWLGPGPSFRPHGLQRQAADGGYPDIPEDVRGPDGIQSGMRSKLIEEARAMGDEDTPVSAGFGNPLGPRRRSTFCRWPSIQL